jgi:hypothetical protein
MICQPDSVNQRLVRQREASRKWRRLHPEASRASSAKWAKANLEKVAARVLRWRQANPSKWQAIRARFFENERARRQTWLRAMMNPKPNL